MRKAHGTNGCPLTEMFRIERHISGVKMGLELLQKLALPEILAMEAYGLFSARAFPAGSSAPFDRDALADAAAARAGSPKSTSQEEDYLVAGSLLKAQVDLLAGKPAHRECECATILVRSFVPMSLVAPSELWTRTTDADGVSLLLACCPRIRIPII